VSVFDVQDPRYLPPKDGQSDMPARIESWCREHGVPVPEGRVAPVRSIVASLAEGFANAAERATTLSGREVRRVHVVGGGAQNTLLCRLLADRLGLPVHAGPVEATAVGNVLARVARWGHSQAVSKTCGPRTQKIVVHEPTGVTR
jgi:rhamnulokinase